MMISTRQYSGDLRIETRRPHAPRNLVYNTETLELSWSGPAGGPAYTHFNIRLGSDRDAPAYRVPIGTTRLFIARVERVTITCWNETVRTESDPARLLVGTSATWTGSSSSSFGLIQTYEIEYNLTANLTIAAPTAAAAPMRRLLVRVFAHATTFYSVDFDPSDFIDSGAIYIEPGKSWVREWGGRSDGKWWPIGPSIQVDPLS